MKNTGNQTYAELPVYYTIDIENERLSLKTIFAR